MSGICQWLWIYSTNAPVSFCAAPPGVSVAGLTAAGFNWVGRGIHGPICGLTEGQGPGLPLLGLPVLCLLGLLLQLAPR